MSTYSVLESLIPQDVAEVVAHRERIGRKFDANEIGHSLRDVAERFTLSYRGDFEYMYSLQNDLNEYGRLTAAQSAGALNVMYRQVLQEQRAWEKKLTPKPKPRALSFARQAPRSTGDDTEELFS